MPDDRINSQSQNDENVEKNENTETENDHFESDTQKIIHRHLENKDDIITDEDIASIRIGMVPPSFDEATEARFEDDARKDAEEDLLSGSEDMNKDENLNEGQITPWDAVDPST